MATENLEAKVKDLEKKLDNLAKTTTHEIERLQAINECFNLFCRMQALHSAGRDYEAVDMYSKDPGTRIYWGEIGYWEGSDAAERNRAIHGKRPEEARVGMWAVHAITSPCIVVAGDGKTAKATFLGVGLVANKNRETGEPSCNWEWDKYGVDFIKENGQWKFWHHHIYRLWHGCGWDEKWAEQFSKPEHTMEIPDHLKPDGPAVDDNPYRLDTVQRLIPVPPEPYETFGDTFSY